MRRLAFPAAALVVLSVGASAWNPFNHASRTVRTFEGLRFSYPNRFSESAYRSAKRPSSFVYSPAAGARVVVVVNHDKTALFFLYKAANQNAAVRRASFPLTVDSFRDTGSGLDSDQQRGLLFRFHGTNYWAQFYENVTSSDPDYGALRSIVASIRPT